MIIYDRPQPGYKQTEVGVIPEDWKLVCIGELEPFVTSGSRGWARHYSRFGASFIRITNLRRESIYLDLSDLKFVDLPERVSEGKRTELFNRDLLISITADIGIIGYVDDSVSKPAYINQHISLVRFDPKKSDSKFIAYFLASESVQRLFRGATDQGAKAGLNLDTIRSLKFAFPPLSEQRSLAQALSDVDALIAALEKAIAKNRHIKTATMQQLLTGKKRLPGFGEGKGYQQTEIGMIPDDWDVVSIGERCQIFGRIGFRGYTVDDIVKPGKGAIAISPSNIRDGQMDFSNSTYVSFAKYEESPEIKIQKGDILLVKTGSTFGKTAIVRHLPDKATLNPQLIVFKNLKTNNILFGYMMGFKIIQHQISKAIAGGALPTLSQALVSQFKFPEPRTEEEQRAIATVLSDMDEAIAALENRRAKTQAIKQGMMQTLLTGKVRLV